MPDEDDFKTNLTYKPVGADKSVAEYANLDAEDASLAKWKASLGITAGAESIVHDPTTQNKVLVQSIGLHAQGRPPIVVDLSSPDRLSSLKDNPFVVKEGITYNLVITFKVQRAVVSGLRYMQVVKRLGVTVDKQEEMIGSYGPAAEAYTKVLPESEAPSGMMARGKYDCRSRFVDDDKLNHLDLEWSIKIEKEWRAT